MDSWKTDRHTNKIQAIASRINKIQLMIRPEPPNPSYIGKKDMVAILIISLPKEYDTEITLIKRNNKIDFKTALEMLRAQELRLKAAREEGNVNAVQGLSNDQRHAPPCDVCSRRNHTSATCYASRQGAVRGGRRGCARG